MQGRIAICPFITPSVNRVVSRSLSPQSAFTYYLKRPFSVSPNDHHLSPRATTPCHLKEQAKGSRRRCLANARHNREKECHPERKPRGLLFSSKKGCLASLDMTVGDMTVGDITVGNMTSGDMTSGE